MNNRYSCKGKRKDNGECIEGYLYITHNGEYEIKKYDEVSNIEGMTYEVIPETVGRCTELKDKNDKLIFEGDILRFVNDDGETSNYEVYWSNDEAGWCIKKEDAFDAMDCWNETRESFEVIGNIYDNPELLEVER